MISGPLPSHEARIGAVRRYLGDPYFESESALLYCGDAIELMQALPPGFIALTTTSPPYNIGKEYEQLLDLDAYLSWCERWMGEIWRLTAEDGAFWLNLGYISIPGRGKAVPLPYLLWDKTPFHFIQEVVWNYGAGVAARQSFSPRNEKLLWYVKNAADYVFNLDDIRDPDVKYPNQKKNGKLKCNPLGKNPTDVWSIPKVTSGSGRASRERTPHPAQFPVALIDRVVRGCSNPGDIVLDPFVGSGTTAVVAANAGRFGLGFDSEPRYLNIAIERLGVRELPLVVSR